MAIDCTKMYDSKINILLREDFRHKIKVGAFGVDSLSFLNSCV